MQASNGNILDCTSFNYSYVISLIFFTPLRTLKYVFHGTMAYENKDDKKIDTKDDNRLILVKAAIR